MQTQATLTLPGRNVTARNWENRSTTRTGPGTSLTQDPDNAQSQRGPRKTPDSLQGQDPAKPEQEPETCETRQNWIPHSRRTLTMPRASEGPEKPSAIPNSCRTLTMPRASKGSEGRPLSIGTPAQNPTLVGTATEPHSNRGTQKLMRKNPMA